MMEIPNVETLTEIKAGAIELPPLGKYIALYAFHAGYRQKIYWTTSGPFDDAATFHRSLPGVVLLNTLRIFEIPDVQTASAGGVVGTPDDVPIISGTT